MRGAAGRVPRSGMTRHQTAAEPRSCTPQVAGAAFTQQQRLARLEALCRALAPKQSPADTLAALGLADAYPFMAARVAGDGAQPSSSGGGAAYLHYVSLLNQVVQMSTQLYHDALVPHHHKYTAHQIALLYVSTALAIGRLRLGRAHVRRTDME